MWDDWLGLLCGGGGVCGMTGLVSCVVVVCVLDYWLGLLCGVCVYGMTSLISCVVVCVWDDWLGVLCGGGVCVWDD